MKSILYRNEIEVRKSTIHGYGVFAKKDIMTGEILEECHYTKLSLKDVDSIDSVYYYYWPKSKGDDRPKPPHSFRAFLFGYASLYNSAEKIEDRMVNYYTSEKDNIFIFKSVKDIKKDQEILSWYDNGKFN